MNPGFFYFHFEFLFSWFFSSVHQNELLFSTLFFFFAALSILLLILFFSSSLKISYDWHALYYYCYECFYFGIIFVVFFFLPFLLWSSWNFNSFFFFFHSCLWIEAVSVLIQFHSVTLITYHRSKHFGARTLKKKTEENNQNTDKSGMNGKTKEYTLKKIRWNKTVKRKVRMSLE